MDIILSLLPYLIPVAVALLVALVARYAKQANNG